jgi:hypothetical protein
VKVIGLVIKETDRRDLEMKITITRPKESVRAL